jgi:cytochrome c peroxidase
MFIRYNSKFSIFNYIVISILLCSSCKKDEEGIKYDYSHFIPSHFPIPISNPDSIPTEAQFTLGKKLFFDPVLSRDGSLSCASCHKPSLAFADTVSVSAGVEGRLGNRNSPSLGNVVYQKKLLKEGGLPTLEMQVLVPIQEHAEFDNNIVEISDKLMTIPKYVEMSQAAYKRDPDPYVITRAISAFERTLFSGNSKYDQFLNGRTKLTAIEEQGLNLFMSNKTNCNSCHAGFLLTNQNIENNGLYSVYKDIGAMRLTQNPSDEGKFKIPSLRNIALTYPYMHDGSLKTLKEVIEHYNSGGRDHKNKNTLIKPLNLSQSEIEALVAFLSTLTDYNFIKNKNYQNE